MCMLTVELVISALFYVHFFNVNLGAPVSVFDAYIKSHRKMSISFLVNKAFVFPNGIKLALRKAKKN